MADDILSRTRAKDPSIGIPLTEQQLNLFVEQGTTERAQNRFFMYERSPSLADYSNANALRKILGIPDGPVTDKAAMASIRKNIEQFAIAKMKQSPAVNTYLGSDAPLAEKVTFIKKMLAAYRAKIEQDLILIRNFRFYADNKEINAQIFPKIIKQTDLLEHVLDGCSRYATDKTNHTEKQQLATDLQQHIVSFVASPIFASNFDPLEHNANRLLTQLSAKPSTLRPFKTLSLTDLLQTTKGYHGILNTFTQFNLGTRPPVEPTPPLASATPTAAAAPPAAAPPALDTAAAPPPRSASPEPASPASSATGTSYAYLQDYAPLKDGGAGDRRPLLSARKNQPMSVPGTRPSAFGPPRAMNPAFTRTQPPPAQDIHHPFAPSITSFRPVANSDHGPAKNPEQAQPTPDLSKLKKILGESKVPQQPPPPTHGRRAKQ